jgi:hypothetical protein
MICKKCSADKERTDFYKQVGDTVMTICKECHKENMKVRSRTNEKVREYDRQRAKTPARREKAALISKNWREKNPQAYKAHTAVNNAVRDGRLMKLACEFCADENVHAHHKDYAKPLDVVWLCPKCHHRLHAIFPELEGIGKVAANG